MSEERHSERDSQLSAMFDGELPGAECELLARRLTRDEVLRAQWSRFSMIGAALRAERGVALHDRVAWRVQSMVAQEATYGDGSVDSAANSRTAVIVPASELRAASAARWLRFARPVAGASIAAGVAAMSIFWLRTQDDSQTLLAANPVTESIVLQPDTSSARPGARDRSGCRRAGVEWRARSLCHAGAEFEREHRAAGAARELRGGAQRIFRSVVAPHGVARSGGHRPIRSPGHPGRGVPRTDRRRSC